MSAMWSFGRRLTMVVAGPNMFTYTYNADGIRTGKTVNGVKHTYALSGTTILNEEWTENGVQHLLVYVYDANDSPVGIVYRNSTMAANATEEYLFVKNIQGDVLSIYSVDGKKLVSYVYDAWGNIVSTTYSNGGANTAAKYNPFRYRGYYRDSETGMYYLNSRYYNPKIGRFISADAYVSTGQGLLGFNMYAYCYNNPVMLIDCLGSCPHGVLGSDCINCLAGDTYPNDYYEPKIPTWDIDESLYDSYRNNYNPPSFRERMFGIVGNNPCIDFNDSGAEINLFDYTLYFMRAGWYHDSSFLDFTIGQANASACMNGSLNKGKKQGINIGAKACVFNISFSVNIFGLNVELHGDVLSAGAGFEITNQKVGTYIGAGWLGGGLAISWG